MILSHDDETIIAQCTPSGAGAIALLRMSGNDALPISARMSRLASGKSILNVPTHTIHYGTVIGQEGKIIDHVLFFVMHGPSTFTGQNTVEITCHNNPFVIEAIIAYAIAQGARLAQPGEFSRRAVLNEKIDLLQAEALNELIHAQTQHALKKSLAQLKGSFSATIHQIETDMIKAIALSEASFEFIDEEIDFAPQIRTIIESTLRIIYDMKRAFDQQNHIRQGVRIALIGSVNAGKSSLFNALLKKERAIVANQAGTTRDTIEAGVYKNGNYWTLIDTAGLRKTEDSIEQAGIKRSFDEAQSADSILLVYDGSTDLSEGEKNIYQHMIAQYHNKIILVQTKADVCPEVSAYPHAIPVSNKTGHNIIRVEQAIEEKIATLFASIESPFLLNKRQFNLLLTFEQRLIQLLPELHGVVSHELITYNLKQALSDLAELTGKSVSEAAMDAVFREFCVGK
jgi:tRNA modification GTPase